MMTALRRKTPPLLAISMGDPAGVGPEVILKAAAALASRRGAPSIVVVGDLSAMRAAAARLRGVPAPSRVAPGEPPIRLTKGLGVLSISNLSARAIRPGHPTVEGGGAAYDYIVTGARMAMSGEVDALVTAPISKDWMNRAGHHFPGHSELLAQLARSAAVAHDVRGRRADGRAGDCAYRICKSGVCADAAQRVRHDSPARDAFARRARRCAAANRGARIESSCG